MIRAQRGLAAGERCARVEDHFQGGGLWVVLWINVLNMVLRKGPRNLPRDHRANWPSAHVTAK